jgi:hypothetical protein
MFDTFLLADEEEEEEYAADDDDDDDDDNVNVIIDKDLLGKKFEALKIQHLTQNWLYELKQ